MDTTKAMAVSRMGIICAEEHAAAKLQQLEQFSEEENHAFIIMYLL